MEKIFLLLPFPLSLLPDECEVAFPQTLSFSRMFSNPSPVFVSIFFRHAFTTRVQGLSMNPSWNPHRIVASYFRLDATAASYIFLAPPPLRASSPFSRISYFSTRFANIDISGLYFFFNRFRLTSPCLLFSPTALRTSFFFLPPPISMLPFLKVTNQYSPLHPEASIPSSE